MLVNSNIALVDINMPGMSGFDVAQLLRHGPQTRDIVIVAFTSENEPAIRNAAIASGFDAYCRKGSAPGLLLDLLEQMSKE